MRMKSTTIAALLALTLCAAGARAKPRPAKVTLSNGQVLHGKVSTTPGKDIRLYVTKEDVRSFPLDVVARMEFKTPVEKMQFKYVKGEMGRGKDPILALKDAYPLREFEVEARMLDGSTLSGRFGTVVFYVEAPDKTHKFVVKRKQTGRVGQTLDDLVYPKIVEFDDADSAKPSDTPELDSQGRMAVRLAAKSLAGVESLYALSSDNLRRLKAEKAAEDGLWRIEYAPGESMLLAALRGGKLLAGWPEGKALPDEEGADKLMALTQEYLEKEPNFFNVRKVLAIRRDARRSDTIYSLVILTREKEVQWAEKPWRLSIWKWRYDADAQTMRLLEDGMFFRIANTDKEQPPEVQLSGDLYRIQEGSSQWTVGKAD